MVRRPIRRFSVVIPTMQRSKYLAPLVEMYCAHRLVGEVIIINNVVEPLPFEHPKLRVLQQEGNIYVNPAWNAGAEAAREDLLIISNDDIWFNPSLVDTVEKFLRLPVGIVGPSFSSMNRPTDGRVVFLPAYRLPHGFGTLMFLRKDHYVPIPEDVLIVRGDDWLFEQQRHRNFQIFGAQIGTHWSITSARSEFDGIKERDRELYQAKYKSNAHANRFRLEHGALLAARSLWRTFKRMGTWRGFHHPGARMGSQKEQVKDPGRRAERSHE